MKKKKSKILSSVLIITVVLSILFVIYVVPCSAATFENGQSYNNFYSNGNNYVGLPLDLSVSGIYSESPQITTRVSNFGGLSYNTSMTTGYGNKFSNAYWTNSDGLGYSEAYKYVSPRLIQAESSDTAKWWNGTTDYTTMCVVNSDVWSDALQKWKDDELTFTPLLSYLRENLSNGPSLFDNTYPTFFTYSLSYDGLIDADIFRRGDGQALANGVFPRYLQLTHFVNNDATTITIDDPSGGGGNYIIMPSDEFINNAVYTFSILYTGVYKGADGKLHEVKDGWSHDIGLNQYSTNMGGYNGYASLYDYVTGNPLLSVPEYALYYVLNTESSYSGGTRRNYNVSLANVVFDLNDIMATVIYYDAPQYAYIKDIEFSIIPSTTITTCWNTNGFTDDSSPFVPLTSLRLSYDNAMNDAVNRASQGYNDYVGGVINEQVFIDSSNFNLLDWLGNTLGSIMNADIIGNVSIGDILSVALGCGFILLVLKFFSGG